MLLKVHTIKNKKTGTKRYHVRRAGEPTINGDFILIKIDNKMIMGISDTEIITKTLINN